MWLIWVSVVCGTFPGRSIGRPDAAISYAHTAATLEAEGRHDPFERGWSEIMEGSVTV